MQFKTIMTVMLVSSASLFVACSDSSDSSPQSSSEVDTREVTKQPEPQTPTLDQRVEATPAPQESTEMTDASTMEAEPKAAEIPAVEEPVEVEVAETVVEVASGKTLYATCIGCHGATGAGGVGPQLTGKSKDFLVERIKAYRAGEQVGPMTAMMAPMVSAMTDEEIDRVVDYILTF
ncbi:c-type cytochrome [Thiomicrospira pelophila]|uniref:c-type cytochrome n=1 Tax=Thiomicrospira pelophila TaxID=934 RepID=UPI001FDF6838|nr:cytochrome c [Thiomicrospira pelophila]